jgi:uncharacterized membrane protein (DUF4010 family)
MKIWLAFYGATGIYLLSAIVGVSDIDPFVLSLAKHGAGQMPLYVAVVAILIASASNDMLWRLSPASVQARSQRRPLSYLPWEALAALSG